MVEWIKILQIILLIGKLILEGMTKAEAIIYSAKITGISEEIIRKYIK